MYSILKTAPILSQLSLRLVFLPIMLVAVSFETIALQPTETTTWGHIKVIYQ